MLKQNTSQDMWQQFGHTEAHHCSTGRPFPTPAFPLVAPTSDPAPHSCHPGTAHSPTWLIPWHSLILHFKKNSLLPRKSVRKWKPPRAKIHKQQNCSLWNNHTNWKQKQQQKIRQEKHPGGYWGMLFMVGFGPVSIFTFSLCILIHYHKKQTWSWAVLSGTVGA